ncbi:MAG: arylsulfatase [Gammaproteobacteria bacterium]|nr:arylsulfatase [Gammaproteobacteria bacterium]
MCTERRSDSVVARIFRLPVAALCLLACSALAAQPAAKPNILIIMGDDIGVANISRFNHGMMGYRTPNIDRIAQEGMMFTDYYGENSCTAGRSAFITGQTPLRTGLTKVGMPGANLGIRPEDPTLATLLKPLGYTTAQFGKNHFGDRDEFLPTQHGFDEFFGNLYHVNAEEEPEDADYPKDPEFRQRFGPRGILRSTVDGQVNDTGPLTRKRMETVDEEFLAATIDFIERSNAAGKPWMAWFNSTRMHFYTHVKDETLGRSGLNFYADGMMEHDDHVGLLLAKLDELGIADNTIVVYTTDNGAHVNTWPDAAVTWFRSEKNTTWEGAYRVPALIRWPGKIAPDSVSNAVMSHYDWVPTLMAAAGVPDVVEQLKTTGYMSGDRRYRVHLDGFNFLPYLTKESDKSPRDSFVYVTDGGDIAGIRFWDRWKALFLEQRAPGTMRVWLDPFVPLRFPLLFDLRMDPFEKADGTNTYWDWLIRKLYLAPAARAEIAKFVQTFEEFPPRQRPDTWGIERLNEAIYKNMKK